jgi:hypothetical protein
LEIVVDAVAVLETTADVARIAVEVDEGGHGAALLVWMTDEIRVEGNFVASLDVDDLERQRVDFRR